MDGKLTQDEREMAFLCATRFIDNPAEGAFGMTDKQLTAVLKDALGVRLIWGGPGKLSGSCLPEGLKICAACNPLFDEELICEGRQTLKFARYLYGINDPDEQQIALL